MCKDTISFALSALEVRIPNQQVFPGAHNSTVLEYYNMPMTSNKQTPHASNIRSLRFVLSQKQT